jgi:hypothetical protein
MRRSGIINVTSILTSALAGASCGCCCCGRCREEDGIGTPPEGMSHNRGEPPPPSPTLGPALCLVCSSTPPHPPSSLLPPTHAIYTIPAKRALGSGRVQVYASVSSHGTDSRTCLQALARGREKMKTKAIAVLITFFRDMRVSMYVSSPVMAPCFPRRC